MKNRRISVSLIKQNLNHEHLFNNTVVARIKKGEEFTSGWQTKKLFINEKNRVKRLKWCRDNLSWISDQWKRVIWTDESPFVLQYGNSLEVSLLTKHVESMPQRCQAVIDAKGYATKYKK